MLPVPQQSLDYLRIQNIISASGFTAHVLLVICIPVQETLLLRQNQEDNRHSRHPVLSRYRQGLRPLMSSVSAAVELEKEELLVENMKEDAVVVPDIPKPRKAYPFLPASNSL